jgi:hypothetical protein
MKYLYSAHRFDTSINCPGFLAVTIRIGQQTVCDRGYNFVSWLNILAAGKLPKMKRALTNAEDWDRGKDDAVNSKRVQNSINSQ